MTSASSSTSGRVVAFYGGPLNCARIELDALEAVRPGDGGRYELADGAYYWHVGEAGAVAASEPQPAVEPEPLPEQSPAAPRPRTRARKRTSA